MASYAPACNELGVMHRQGTLVRHDARKAAELFGRACDYGSADGCTNLGATYLLGEGVAQDLGKATKLLRYGCERGIEKACMDLRVFRPGDPPPGILPRSSVSFSL